jgi:predicted transcriptional regulator
MIPMVSNNLKLTAQIVMSHASMRELTQKELVTVIKGLYATIASLEAEDVTKPSIPLKDIVKAKHVVCLECGKKFRTLKVHLRKAHNLKPYEYYRRFALDPKKFPLVCKDYSATRSKMAKDRGLSALGARRKKAGA